jgi:hypothetical protein
MRPIVLLPPFLFVALGALAAASMPDPLWVPGVYDETDGDVAVLQVLAVTGATSEPPPDSRPSIQPVSRPAAPSSPLPRSAPGHIAASRAPPR